MMRKNAQQMERVLRACGVYKPYVSADGDKTYFESYPLTAIVTNGGVDPEMGPAQNIKLTDCTLPRLGQDSIITTARVFIGQDLMSHVARLLIDFHEKAHERALRQDSEAIQKGN